MYIVNIICILYSQCNVDVPRATEKCGLCSLLSNLGELLWLIWPIECSSDVALLWPSQKGQCSFYWLSFTWNTCPWNGQTTCRLFWLIVPASPPPLTISIYDQTWANEPPNVSRPGFESSRHCGTRIKTIPMCPPNSWPIETDNNYLEPLSLGWFVTQP